MRTIPVLLLIAIISFYACQPTGDKGHHHNLYESVFNPPAEGFNLEASDSIAMALADSVMQASGGRKAWDDTHYVSWNFFGFRTLLWDKYTNWVRLDFPSDSLQALVQIDSLNGKVMKGGKMLEQPDSVQKYLQTAKSIWINDAYWLFMPFKLKDSGVTLKYSGEKMALDSTACPTLKLTFENVGDTPQNKYWVKIDPETYRVKEWSYFSNASDTAPRFTTPWKDYNKYGELWLSGDRGQRQITNIHVMDSLDQQAFKDLSVPIDQLVE